MVSKYLDNKLDRSDKRYCTFKRALELLQNQGGKIMIETGTARLGCADFTGDGGATYIFAEYAKDHDLLLYSVDCNEQSIKTAKSALADSLRPYTVFVLDDSLHFLSTFDQRVDFIYFDSLDFDLNNPLASQLHHLQELEAIYPRLSQQAVVLIDDCALAYGGKGRFVIATLLQWGWRMIEQGYQVVLTRSDRV